VIDVCCSGSVFTERSELRPGVPPQPTGRRVAHEGRRPAISGNDWRRAQGCPKANGTAGTRADGNSPRNSSRRTSRTSASSVGWKAPQTLLTCYVAPDVGTQREALAKRREIGSA